MSGANMRGLTIFVSDIRNCQSKEQEDQRVQKELANIRMKFTAKKSLSSYDRRKYVWKLVYTYMLGYEFDFGHNETINLISASTPNEKQVGYIAASVLFSSDDESIPFILETIRHDLHSNLDPVQCMALSALANIGGTELCTALVDDVKQLVMSRVAIVRKKAALCMLRILRVKPSLVPVSEWASPLLTLLDDKNLGVVMSVVSFILGLATIDPEPFIAAVPHIILHLTRLAKNNACTVDYLYYSTANPWLQVKLLRLLQCFPVPAEATHRSRLTEILVKIITHTEVTKSVNKNNADHSVLFEAVNLIIKQGNDSDPHLRGQAVELLGRFLRVREPNIKYLGLETMARLAALDGTGAAIRKHQEVVLACLKETDVSIRLRALDLIFAMCDTSNAMPIVEALLLHVVTADYRIKQEMMLKLAILAERHAPTLNWYVDTILQMVSVGGDEVDDAIWHRVVQIVTNNEGLQVYATRKLFDSLGQPRPPPVVVKIGSYLLGEFGMLLTGTDVPESERARPEEQFNVLQQHFARSDNVTKAIMLTAYCKMAVCYGGAIASGVDQVLGQMATVMDAELQQRAVEYHNLPRLPAATLDTVLGDMPPYKQTESVLEKINEERRKELQNKKDFLPSSGGGAAASSDANPADTGDGADESKDTPEPASAEKGAAAPAGKRTLVGLDDAKAKKLTLEAFQRFAVTNSGVLFQDDSIQIGCRIETEGAEGTVSVFFGNKTDGPFRVFKVRVQSTPALTAEQVDVAPDVVEARKQVKVAFKIACVMPFKAPLALQVSFLTSPTVGYALPLRLPVMAPHFITAGSLPFEAFGQRWLALEGNNREQTVIAEASKPVDMAWAAQLLTSLRLGIVTPSAAAATQPSVYGAGMFRTTTVRNGQRVGVGVLVRLDGNAKRNMWRLVVRAQAPPVAAALAAAVGPQLGTVKK